jgi:hypothetical protein
MIAKSATIQFGDGKRHSYGSVHTASRRSHRIGNLSPSNDLIQALGTILVAEASAKNREMEGMLKSYRIKGEKSFVSKLPR